MLPRDLLSSVRRIEIRTRRLVNEIFSGQYGSVFRGLGMEFAEVREYTPGDDVRSIDWNVTARTGHPYIKKYVAEREMTVLLMVDGSASMQFGTAEKWKADLAAEVAAVLGFSAIRNSDKVGLCLFSDHVEKFIQPQKGRTHTLRVIRDVLEFSPPRRQTHMEEALRYVNRVLKRKAVVFLVSDFYNANERLLAITNKRHDLIALQIQDPLEQKLPDVGLLELAEAETGRRMVLDTSRTAVRRQYQEKQARHQQAIESMLHRHGIDHILLQTDRSFVKPLLQFFQTRAKRFR